MQAPDPRLAAVLATVHANRAQATITARATRTQAHGTIHATKETQP